MGLVPWRSKQPEPGSGEGSPLAALRAEIDRLFDSFIREPVSHLEWPFGGRGWSPAVDVGETDEEVIVQAELPGMKPEDLDISISAGQLVLAGEKRQSSEKQEKGFYHRETRYGSFRRTVPLPQSADPERVEADYKDGVLTVRIKKTAATPPKRVHIRVEQ